MSYFAIIIPINALELFVFKFLKRKDICNVSFTWQIRGWLITATCLSLPLMILLKISTFCFTNRNGLSIFFGFMIS